jgi:hypothetical protein
MSTLKTSARYPLPAHLEAALAELLAYWQGIQRGYRIMPYWDDVDLVKLQDERRDLMLFDVRDDPARFRFSVVGDHVTGAYGKPLEGLFLDEIPPLAPLRDCLEQCAATVSESAPTYVRRLGDAPDQAPYARLLLPLWGNGRIEMLLGAVAPTAAESDR